MTNSVREAFEDRGMDADAFFDTLLHSPVSSSART